MTVLAPRPENEDTLGQVAEKLKKRSQSKVPEC